MLEGVPVLSLVILIPLLGAFITMGLGKYGKHARVVALAFSVVAFLLSLLITYEFVTDPTSEATGYHNGYQFYEEYTWIDSIGVSYIVGIDGISLPLFVLTTLLCMLAILFSWDTEKRQKEYFGLMLILEVGVLGVFVSLDYFMFYVFWEVVLIPMYFEAGLQSFSMEAIAAESVGFAKSVQVGIFAAMLFGFGVKLPMVPFHTWLPDAHVEAPTAGSVLLAGLLLKMGGYGLIRVAIPSLPDGASELSVLMAVIGVVSIVYGAMLCLAQKDLKKMVAYSSISHMGFVLLGYATLSQVGIVAGVFQMFAHGLVTAVLFMMCGVLQHKAGTRLIPMLGGLSKRMPIAATLITAGFLASLGLPGLVSFAAEFMVFYATFVKWSLWVFVPLVAVAVTAAYYLWALQRSMFGPMTEKIDTTHLKDMDWFEYVPVAVLIALIAVFGVFPAMIFSRIDSAVEIVMRLFGGG